VIVSLESLRNSSKDTGAGAPSPLRPPPVPSVPPLRDTRPSGGGMVNASMDSVGGGYVSSTASPGKSSMEGIVDGFEVIISMTSANGSMEMSRDAGTSGRSRRNQPAEGLKSGQYKLDLDFSSQIHFLAKRLCFLEGAGDIF